MSISSPPDTLAYHRARPLSVHANMSEVSCSSVAKACAQFMKADKQKNTVPESEALWFYMMNHGMAELQKSRAPLEPLGPLNSFAQDYYQILTPKAVRAFYYLLLICTRESRHVSKNSTFQKGLEEKFGFSMLSFNAGLSHHSTGAYQNFLESPPVMPIGQYAQALQWIFYKGHFSSSFGGPKWGRIADCLSEYVHGNYSAEMMLDTIWTLAHNGGPIFNKGMLYGHYTDKLTRILDVQRSGQIPEMVLHDPQVSEYTTPAMEGFAALIQQCFPGSVGDKVDWQKVKELGAVGSYGQKHGYKAPSKFNPILKPAVPEVEIAPAVIYTKETHFEVMPGVMVPKFKIPRTETGGIA